MTILPLLLVSISFAKVVEKPVGYEDSVYPTPTTSISSITVDQQETLLEEKAALKEKMLAEQKEKEEAEAKAKAEQEAKDAKAALDAQAELVKSKVEQPKTYDPVVSNPNANTTFSTSSPSVVSGPTAEQKLTAKKKCQRNAVGMIDPKRRYDELVRCQGM